MKVALYARVSTDKCEICGKKPITHEAAAHEFRGQDPEAQLRELREWCQAQKHLIESEYVDRGISGTKKSRPELDRLMRDATKGLRDFKSVVVWRLSRFGRSTQHLHALISELRDAGVGFISKQEGFDLDTPIGKMFFTILCALAEFERDVIAENTRIGMKLARSKGHIPGPKIDPAKGPSRTTLWRHGRMQRQEAARA